MNYEHLKEEEVLATSMKQSCIGRKDKFSDAQWRYSKKEFWGMIKDNIEASPKTVINIGCGYDTHFISEFEQRGYLIVNFDIVYDMLYTHQRMLELNRVLLEI